MTREEDLQHWKFLLSYVEQWQESEQSRNVTTTYELLLRLHAMGLIREDDPRLLLELVEGLPRKDEVLVNLVRNYMDGCGLCGEDQVDGTASDIGDSLDNKIRRIAFQERLGWRWKKVAISLGLRQEDIDEIDHQARSSNSDLCCLAENAMQTWRRRLGHRATETALDAALQRSGEKLIADRIWRPR